MACAFQEQCGFYKWLAAEKPDIANDGCKKNPNFCGRLNDEIPTLPIELFGPKTRDEMNIGFPPIPNTNGRPPRRILGGGHGDWKGGELLWQEV